ncbi:MAG: hypothetical protein IKX21_00095 [Deltaproteobacteria bacterium]|nr:hypothetical protein [Deltaproteobacteria bacterium]
MFPAVTALLPHRRPMLLLDALTGVQNNQIQAIFTVREDNIFLRSDGTLEAVALLEAMAQCFAAGQGLRGSGQNRVGYLAAVRRCNITGEAHLGDILCASARAVAQVGAIIIVEGEMTRGEEKLASAEFKIYTLLATEEAKEGTL